jgi:uncharacterized membrane protein YbaN (DUF454 family)
MNNEKNRKWLLVIAGYLALGLGLIGIFVPLLPTTPLLLLAAGCFMRSSPRLYTWLIHRKWFGKYIHHYREHRAITTQARIVTLLLLWSVIGVTAIFIVDLWWLRVLLGVVAVSVTLHLFHLKRLTPEMMKTSQHIFNDNEQSASAG